MLAIVTSHPIQYQAPLWRELATDGRVPFEVWFLTPHATQPSHDREFGRTFAWDVDLLAGYPHRFLEIEPGWRLDRFNGIRLQQSWRALLRARGVSALWIEGWRFRTLWSAVAAAHSLGIPVWLRGESNDLRSESGAKAMWKRIALRWYFRRVDRFLCIGTPNRRFYRRHGVPERSLVSAPYCVDNTRFSAAAAALRPQRAEWRERWRIPAAAKCILFCGKLIPKKRPLDVMMAARDLAANTPRPLHLLWVGDGTLSDDLHRAQSQPGTPASTFAGFLNQSEIAAAYAAADCLVLPSEHGETWGLVVNEALASGLPAIVSDRCGCAEDLGLPQGRPHVFRCGDIRGLADSLAQVLDAPPPPDRLAAIISAHAPARTVETVAALARSL